MENKKYDIEAYDMNEVINMNSLLNDLDEIFNNALDNKEKILLGGVEWKRCGILMKMI